MLPDLHIAAYFEDANGYGTFTNNIVRQMRFAYENRFEVVKRGIAAYEAAQKFTKHTMGENFLRLWQTMSS